MGRVKHWLQKMVVNFWRTVKFFCRPFVRLGRRLGLLPGGYASPEELRALLIALHVKLDTLQNQAVNLHHKLDQYHDATCRSLGEVDGHVADALAETDRLVLAFLKSDSFQGGQAATGPSWMSRQSA